MGKEITLDNNELNRFISDEQGKVLSYLRKTFSVSDDDLNDIYQESSTALFLNIYCVVYVEISFIDKKRVDTCQTERDV